MDSPVRDGEGNEASHRSVLLVSAQFPPSSLVGAHRARHLAKHLPTHGWQPTVVTVRPDYYEEALDHRLGELVPPTIEVQRVRAVPARFARRIGIGDIGLRSYGGLRGAVLRRLAENPPDLVFITGFPFYPMLMARALRKRGVPVVLDFQDPWISEWGADQPILSKPGMAHRLAGWLEPRAVRAASGIMSVSAEQNRAMRRRYPHLAETRFCDLPIGGDWDDYEVVPSRPAGEGRVLLYAGAFLPRSVAVVTAVFRALRTIRASTPQRLAGTKLRFIGTAAVTDPQAQTIVMPIAEAQGVADLVEETPWRLPYLKALGMMRHCHANLLIGSDEPHYTASKIYPALMSGRPFLSIFREESSAHAILKRCGGGIALSFGDAGIAAGLETEIGAALCQMLEQANRFGPADRAAIEPFTAPEIARRCAAFFNEIVARC